MFYIHIYNISNQSMDLSRLNTLSLNNSNDIIANNISLINGNTTSNILNLFVLKDVYNFTTSIFVDTFYNTSQTYSKSEINSLINSGYNNLMIDNMLLLKSKSVNNIH